MLSCKIYRYDIACTFTGYGKSCPVVFGPWSIVSIVEPHHCCDLRRLSLQPAQTQVVLRWLNI